VLNSRRSTRGADLKEIYTRGAELKEIFTRGAEFKEIYRGC
jgi:hypothetical protein